MGWRVHDHYEAAERERIKQQFASLSIRERISVRLSQIIGIAGFLLFVFILGSVAFGASIEPGRIEVTDGDTIQVSSTAYRLVGFDTPEAGMHAKCERERSLANAATQRLRRLISSGGIDLTRVRCSCPPGTEGTMKCNFKRFCAVLTIRGEDVGRILIKEGLAHPYVCGETRCPRRKSWCEGVSG